MMRLVIMNVFALGVVAPAMAQQAPMDKVYTCVDISDAGQRHACFDALVPELKKARTGALGITTTPPVRLQPEAEAVGLPRAAPSSPLTAPVLKPAEARALRDQAIDRVSAGVKAITIGADGKARFSLENGQIWKQVDTTKLRNLGNGPWTAEIRKAA